MKTSLVTASAPEQEVSVRSQTFWAKENLGAACAAFARLAPCCASARSPRSDLVLAQVLEIVARAGLLRFWEMASGLDGERPSPSAKVVDGKRRRLVEVLGNHERLGKKSWLCWHDDSGRATAVCQQPFGRQPPPYPAKSDGFGAGFNKFTLAGRPASGGQPA